MKAQIGVKAAYRVAESPTPIYMAGLCIGIASAAAMILLLLGALSL